MIKQAIHQKGKAILYIYALNNKASKFIKQISTELKE